MRRQHMQVYLSEQLQQNNPLAYVFFTQNAADGENFGLESEGSYRLGEHWRFSGSTALLHTRYLGVTRRVRQPGRSMVARSPLRRTTRHRWPSNT